MASKFFLDETYTEDTREEVEAMTVDIETAYLQCVTGFDWITNSTVSTADDKREARHKLTCTSTCRKLKSWRSFKACQILSVTHNV